jgi:hypothetical protein
MASAGGCGTGASDRQNTMDITLNIYRRNQIYKELDGSRSVRFGAREVKLCWSVIEQKLIILSSLMLPKVKPLVPDAFAVVSTHQFALGPRGGFWPVLLMCNAL